MFGEHPMLNLHLLEKKKYERSNNVMRSDLAPREMRGVK